MAQEHFDPADPRMVEIKKKLASQEENGLELTGFIVGMLIGATDADVGKFIIAAATDNAVEREGLQTTVDDLVGNYREIINRPSK